MSEYPVILSHNVLDGATLSGNDITGHELERLRDGYRHTWWEAPGTSIQQIDVRAKNFIVNPDFEVDVSGWALYTSGSGAGTFARNTTAPLVGNGDGLLTATTADSSTNICQVIQFRPIFMKANRTYRLMFRAMVQDASQKSIRFGFLAEGLVETANFYTDGYAGTSDTGLHVDVTPTSDGWYHPYIRALEAQTLQIDDVVAGEARSVDTLIIDRGHTLLLADVRVYYRNNEQTTWSYVANESATQCVSDGPVYITFDGATALSWRVEITAYTLYPDIPVAKVPLVFLGERWTMNKYFHGGFDPHQENRVDYMSIGDRGIAQRTVRFNQRLFKAGMLLESGEYENYKKFMDDTENGAKPFFLAWKPTSDVNDILCMRLRGSREAPYQNGALREWNFEAEELAGRREL